MNDKFVVTRVIFFVTVDACCVFLAELIALILRFDLSFSKIEAQYVEAFWNYLPYNIIITVIIFFLFHLYQRAWRFAGLEELQGIVAASVSLGMVQVAFFYWKGISYPRSCHVMYIMLLIVLTTFNRFGYRCILGIKRRFEIRNGVGVMIIGAGQAGAMLIREMQTSKFLKKQVKCIIDDDTAKKGTFVHGIKVVGTRQDIKTMVKKYDIREIDIALPSSSKKTIKEILDICRETECESKILPGLYQFVNGNVHISNLRNVEVEDLLGRDPINVDIDSIMNYVSDKTVLVTGGGGSIGSELCRQIAAHNPKKLIIVDIYENNAYDIQQELVRNYPELDLVVLIASVRNTARINRIFEMYRPEIVYHAAAHKHVPLMESSPNEAVKNNVFGTLKTVQAADKYGTKRFVLISTDKAVNPTNIMGATKRICEMIVQTYNNHSKTEFVAVRFGNVLGSNGSVIPLFKRQIEEGGPVTVTHPDIIRYFMTIPEAVSLVLQAGVYAAGGEIFVLDMGEPVKILDLAMNLIRLSGMVPGEDIEVEFTGLRPGEKLYEELLMKEEGLQETDNNLIHIGKPIEMDEEKFLSDLDELYRLTLSEPEDIRPMVKKIVPTYVVKQK